MHFVRLRYLGGFEIHIPQGWGRIAASYWHRPPPTMQMSLRQLAPDGAILDSGKNWETRLLFEGFWLLVS